MNNSWSPLNSVDSSFVAQSRLDYAVYLEAMGCPPNVAFENRNTLEDWISKEFSTYEINPLYGGANAFRVGITDPRFTYLEQVWVKISYTNYREAMKHVAKHYHGVTNVDAIDADHVAAKTIFGDMPDVWIALFPTYKSSNRGFGRIEKRVAKAVSGFEKMEISPLMIFKILTGKMPKNLTELNLALSDLDNQFCFDRNNYLHSYLQSVREEISKFIQRN